MKRIVDGLRYDTENATLIGVCKWGGNDTDDPPPPFNELFKTANGRFFITAFGDAPPDWAETGLEKESIKDLKRFGIIPLDGLKAISFAEKVLNLDVDTIEEHFGDMISDA